MKRYVLFLVSAVAALTVLAAACSTEDDGSQPSPSSTPDTGTATATSMPPTATTTATPEELEPTSTPLYRPPDTPTPNPYEDQLRMVSYRNRWEARGLDSYEFDFQWMCFCGREITQPVRIRVQDGDIVSITNIETGEAVEQLEGDSLKFRTIDGLFDWIQEEIDLPADELEVEYDREFNYPASAFADRITNLYDDEMRFTVSNLRANPESVDLDELQEQLDDARMRWSGAGFQSYTFDFQWTCCGASVPRDTVRIRVENGETTSITDPETGEPMPEPVYRVSLYRTIDELLDWIQHEIDIPADWLGVKYDSEFGYPVAAHSDPHRNAVDDERTFQISRFQPGS